jgi:S-adenosyl-L-methionine hydrolase (adenosine-forming)
MNRPLISLLTDFGVADHYVAAMKGVILGICPDAQIVDISHEITPYAITEAAYTLAQAWKCFPSGTVHLIVVDPGVGSSRRPIVAEAGGHRFVAPDNGVLEMVLDAEPKHRVREITARTWFRQPVSQTFHGRDIFAPVAARLAGGLAISRFGPLIKDCVRPGFSRPYKTKPNVWTGIVLKVDRFGNIVTNFDSVLFGNIIESKSFRLRIGSGVVSRIFENYAAAPDDQPFAIHGSAGYVEISVRQRSAAAILGVLPGNSTRLRVPRTPFSLIKSLSPIE